MPGHITLRVIPLLAGMTLLFSCGRDIEKVSRLENPDTIPAIHATGIEIIYSDSAIVRITIQAPELKDFTQLDTLQPKSEFPKGLTATFYNRSGGIESVMTSRYAIYYSKRRVFEARDSVVVKNYSEDQELHADIIWWDEVKEKIWSDEPVTIITADGTTRGNAGFDADQNFSEYHIRGARGDMRVKEEK